MDPRDSHFNRSWYDPPPPPADYYPHPQFQPPPHRPPPPPPRHHHGGDHHPADDPRLYYPNPPLHHLDTPPYDHHHHRPPPPRVSARGGPHIDPWNGGPNPRNARSALDGDLGPPLPRPDPTQVAWDRRDLERRRYRMRDDEMLVEDFRDRAPLRPPPPPPPPSVSMLRVREDGILGEDFDPHDSSGRRIPVLTSYQDVDDTKMSAAEIAFQETRYANKGNDEVFRNSDIGFHWNQHAVNEGFGDGVQENHYKGKRKWVHADDGFQENHYKGKRWNFNGGSSQYNNECNSSKRPVQKTSALGRIQSGISVWNRIQVVIPSSVVSKKPISSCFQVSNVLDGTTEIVRGTSIKPASDGSNKESGTLIKSVHVGTKPACDGSKKAKIKHVSDGPKKVIGSSSKQAGNGSSRPPPKRVTRVPSAKKVTAHKHVKLVEEKMHEDLRQDDTIIESKPTNHTSSRPFETASIDTSAFEQSGKDANFVYWPMEVAPPIENTITEQSTNAGMPVYEQMVVMTPTKDINLDQGTIVVSSENTAAGQAAKDVNFFQPFGSTSSEKNRLEHAVKKFDAVQEPTVAASAAEDSAAARSRKNVKLVQDDAVSDRVKEETSTLFEEVAQDFVSPFVSNTRIVIDISSDSSSDEAIVAKSPSKVIRSVNNANAENCIKERDIVKPSEELGMTINESSSFRLAGDAQVVQEVTMSVGAVISPIFCGLLKDDNENRNEEQIDGQHTLGAPSIRDEVEILGEPIENCDFPVPSKASNLVQELNPHNSATDNAGNDLLLPSRGLPMSESAPVFEDYSVNAAMSPRMEQVLPFSFDQKGPLMDVSRACESSFVMETRSDSHPLFDSQCHDNNDNANDQYQKTTKNGSSLASKSFTLEAERETKSDNTMQYHHPASVKTHLLQSY